MVRDNLERMRTEYDRWVASDKLQAGIATSYPKALARDELIDEIERLGVMHYVKETTRNILLVGDRFYFFPMSLQWRRKGSQKLYSAKSFTDFWERFAEPDLTYAREDFYV